MNQSGSQNWYSLKIFDVPQQYNLLEFGLELENLVKIKNVIIGIKWEIEPTTVQNVIVLLNNEEAAQHFVKMNGRLVNHKNVSWKMNIAEYNMPRKKNYKEIAANPSPKFTGHAYDFNLSTSHKFRTSYQILKNHFLPIIVPNPKKILEKLKTSEDLFKELEVYFSKFAKLSRKLRNDSADYLLEFEPLVKQTVHLSQPQFNDECDKILEKFKSDHPTVQFEKTVSSTKYIYCHNFTSDTGVWDVGGVVYKLYFEWNVKNNPEIALVTGKSLAVESFIKELQFLSEKSSNVHFKQKENHPSTLTTLDSQLHRAHTWNDLLEINPSLFTDFQRRCVLVNHLPLTCEPTYSDLCSIFEGVENVGQIMHIYRLYDGYLIAFEDEQSVAMVLKLDELTMGGVEVQIYLKEVPPVNGNLLCINEISDAKHIKTALRQYPRLASKYQVFPMKSNKFLILFEKSILNEIDEIINHLSNHKSTKQSIVNKVVYSDHILLKKPAEIGEDQIKVAFKKLGFEVTLVEKTQSKEEIVVCFSSYKDAFKILENPIEIKGTILSISYVLNKVGCLTSIEYKKYVLLEKDLQQFTEKFAVGENVINLVYSSHFVTEQLNGKVKGVADVVLPKSFYQKGILEVTFRPNIKQKDQMFDQESFEEECKNKITQFFQLFVTKPINQLQRGASDKLEQHFNQWSTSYLLYEEDDLVLLINDKRTFPTVTGFKDHIDKLQKLYTKTTKLFQCTESDARVCIDCDVVRKVETKVSVKVTPGHNNNSLFIEGFPADIASAQKTLQKILNEIVQERNFSVFTTFQKNFILSCGNCYDVEKKIQSTLTELGLHASFQVTGKPILYSKQKILQDCLETIRNIIEVKEFLLEDEIEEILNDSSWKQIETFVENTQFVQLMRPRPGQLVLVGISPDFGKAKDLIATRLSQSEETEQLVTMDDIILSYILLFSNKLEESEILRDIDWHGTENEGIHLSGKSRKVKKAKKWLDNVVLNLKISRHPIAEIWQKKYLNGEVGKQFLKSLQVDKQCAIAHDSLSKITHDSKVQEASMKPIVPNPNISPILQTNQKYPTVQVPGSNATIRSIEGNIIGHKVDAIVNASNEELELRHAGVSGAILNSGGYIIQKEMSAIRITLPTNKLVTGTAVTTSSGLLSNCKKIVHVAGPRWSNYSNKEAQRLLKESVRSCLIEADMNNLQSIAIPAISCGVFGGKPDLSAQLIVEAVVEFFQERPRTFLDRVDLIELSNMEVIDAFSKHLNKIKATSSQVNLDKNRHELHSPTDDNSLTVLVEQNDILQCKADALLITSGPEFDLDSRLSKEVVRFGGIEMEHYFHNPLVKKRFYKICKCSRLPFRLVIQLVINNNNSDHLFEIFKELEMRKFSSIAIPAIGTGRAEGTIDDSVQTIRRAIEDFQKTHPKYLKTIKVVVFNKKAFSSFKCLISAPAEKKHIKTASLFDRQTSYSSPTRSKPPMYGLILCSLNERINQEAITEIKEKFKTKYVEKQIDEASLIVEDKDYLERLEKDCEVKTKNLDKLSLCVCGLQEDVKVAVQKIRKTINQRQGSANCYY